MRTSRSILSFATALMFTAVTMLTAFVTTPLLTDLLKADRFGAYRMLIDLSGYLMLLDFGLGGALSPLVARALGRGETEALWATIAAGMKAYLRLTGIILVVGLAATPLVVWLVVRAIRPTFGLIVRPLIPGLGATPIVSWLITPEVVLPPLFLAPPGFVRDLCGAWALALLAFLALVAAPFRTLAEARQRGYWLNVLITVQCILITGLAVPLAWAGWGVTGQAAANTIGTAAYVAMLAWSEVRQGLRPLRSALAAPRNVEIRAEIRDLGLPSFLIGASNRVGLLSDSLVAGAFLGPATAGSLYITTRLASLAQAQLQAIGTTCWPGLAELHAQGLHEVFNRRLVELSTLVAVLGIAVLGPIAACGRPFFDIWMRGKPIAFAGEPVILAAAANALILGLVTLWGWCFASTGQIRLLMAPTILATAINAGASLGLTWRLGSIGPVLGTLAANLLVTLWWYPLLLRRVYGVSLRDLAGGVARPVAWGLPYAGGLWWLAHAYPPRGWIALGAEMAAAALGFLAFGAAAILGPTDRALWRARLAGLLQFVSSRGRR